MESVWEFSFEATLNLSYIYFDSNIIYFHSCEQ